ncbi:hypothetical protein ABT317_44370, partial [Streptomyces carpinensis]
MAAMHRGLVHVLAWSLATSAAVTLSWWGVHTVMAGTAYDQAARTRVVERGGSAAVNLSRSVTDVVLLDGGE